MSKKLQEKSAQNDKKYVIDEIQLKYLNDLDTVQRSFNYYQEQLKTNYLQQIALQLGFLPEDKLEFSIDLKSPNRELTIKRI